MTIPNLWPADGIRLDVVSPISILKVQAVNLQQMTGGLLIGKVQTIESDDKMAHTFDIYASALNYEHRILVAYHAANLAYPVTIEAEIFLEEIDDELTYFNNSAGDQAEFLKLVKKVFNSAQIVSVIQSLIARINDMEEQNIAA